MANSDEESYFSKCEKLEDFLVECVNLYFSTPVQDERLRESSLSVYMAFRDHFPDYMKYLTLEQRAQLDLEIKIANPKIIKLRRMVIGAIAKVA